MLLWLLATLGISNAVHAEPWQQPTTISVDVDQLIKPSTGDLDKMVQRRTIRVLTTISKTHYFINKGQQRGLVYDSLRLFEKELNQSLDKGRVGSKKHLKVALVFIPVAPDDLLLSLRSGRGDMIAANMTITPERQRQVDFTLPTMTGVREQIVAGPAAPIVTRLEDMAGQNVYVRKTSSYYASLLTLNKTLLSAGRPAIRIHAMPEPLADEDLLDMVHAGLIPFTVVDQSLATFWKMILPKLVVNEALSVREEANVAWAVRKNNPQLKTALDAFIKHHAAGDKDRNLLLTRYLKHTKYVESAGAEAEQRKFQKLAQYFQKYGTQYAVDWLLMAAMAYQESRLDQTARSPAGAIGVMQIMPATGKELNVGDITRVEPNIHAGIKYIRWMIDTYYGKERMSDLDKALFSFASYNAGPRRVRELREEAVKRGLNPSVWFHNVEYVAADKIGAETVTYVANIYKYYIAYKLMVDAQAEKDDASKTMTQLR